MFSTMLLRRPLAGARPFATAAAAVSKKAAAKPFGLQLRDAEKKANSAKKAEENAKFLQRQIEEKKATELGKFGAAGMNEIEFALNAKKVTAREV